MCIMTVNQTTLEAVKLDNVGGNNEHSKEMLDGLVVEIGMDSFEDCPHVVPRSQSAPELTSATSSSSFSSCIMEEEEEMDTSTCSLPVTKKEKEKSKRRISFGTIEFRSYKVIPGHPEMKTVHPLSLGWETVAMEATTVDYYEHEKQKLTNRHTRKRGKYSGKTKKRRHHQYRRTTQEERRQILLASGVENDQIALSKPQTSWTAVQGLLSRYYQGSLCLIGQGTQ